MNLKSSLTPINPTHRDSLAGRLVSISSMDKVQLKLTNIQYLAPALMSLYLVTSGVVMFARSEVHIITKKRFHFCKKNNVHLEYAGFQQKEQANI